jgi:hypothetical protein
MDDNVPLDAEGGLTPEIAQALARICRAEGIAPPQVRSIQIVDGELTARIERHAGGSRLVIYPLAALVADGVRNGR